MDGGSRGVGLLDYEEQSGLLAPIPRDPSYNYGSILPFRKPKAGGAAEWSPAYSELVKGVADAFTAPGRAYAGTMPAENMPFEAMNLAGNVQLASAGGLLGQGRLAAQPGTLGLTAYHGSPHKFDKFDMSKIGTGEGAQAYGHGLYFAENPNVAGDYARKLAADKNWRAADLVGVDPVTEMYTAVGKSGVKKSFHNQAEALDWARQGSEHLYKVDIPDAQVAKMLDWDKPLSQQPESVRVAIRQAAEIRRQQTGTVLRLADDTKGEDLVRTIGEGRLQQAGIPGIRYLDQGSRAGGQGTSNFVLFDPELAKILERK